MQSKVEDIFYFFKFLLVIILIFSCQNEVKIIIEPASLILEDVEVGTTISKEVILKNIGNTDIDSLKAKSSCGCTIASKIPSSLPSGATREFLVSYNSSANPKNFKEFVFVEYKNSKIALPIIGNSTKTISTKPSALQFQTNNHIHRFSNAVLIESYKYPITDVIPKINNNLKLLFDRQAISASVYQITEYKYCLKIDIDSSLIDDLLPIQDMLNFRIVLKNGDQKDFSIPIIMNRKPKIVIHQKLIRMKFNNDIEKWQSNIININSSSKIANLNYKLGNSNIKFEPSIHSAYDMKNNSFTYFIRLYSENKAHSIKYSSGTLLLNNDEFILPILFLGSNLPLQK